MKAIEIFIQGAVKGCHSSDLLDQTLSQEIDFDVIAWLQSSEGILLSNFILKHPANIYFSLTNEDIETWFEFFP